MFSCRVSKGVLTPLFAATHPKAEYLNGKVCRLTSPTILHASSKLIHNIPTQLLTPFARLGTIPDNIRERCAQETLWDWLEAQTDCFDRTKPPNSAGLRADSLEVVKMYPSEVKLI